MENNENNENNTEKDRKEWELEVSCHPDAGRILLGVLLVLGALALLAKKLGFIGGFRFWPIVLSVVLAFVLIDGIRNRSFEKIVFSLAFLIIVNDELLHMEAITPWPVLLAAIAITAGLKMLFPGFGRRRANHRPTMKINRGSTRTGGESRDGKTIAYTNNFGGTVKYINGEIEKVYLENSFGAMEVYFDNAVLQNGTAEVHVKCSFGAIELYVPTGWRVIMDVTASLGAAEEQGHCDPMGENVLYVDGFVSLGAVEIQYV